MTTRKTVKSKELTGEESGKSIFLHYAALSFFSLTLFFIHLPLGGAREWGIAGTILLILIALSLHLIRSYLRGHVIFTLSLLYILPIILILLSLTQITFSCRDIPFLENNYSVWESLSQYLSTDIYPSISLTPSITLKYLILFSLSTLVFYLSLEIFRKKQQFYLLPVIFLFSIALNSLFGFFNESGVLSERIFCYVPSRVPSVSGTFINRNHFAVFIEMGLCSSLGLLTGSYLSKSFRYKKPMMLFSGILFCFFMASLLFSYSRAGISLSIFTLLIFFIILILELKKRKKILRSLYLLILIVVGLSLAAVRGLTYVMDRYETTFYSDDPSLMGRFDFWDTTIEMIKNYWALGAGFGSFTYVSTRFESGLIPNKIANHAHNDWLELFAEVGIPFAVLIIVLILYFYISNFIKVVKQENTFRKWLGVGAGFSILSLFMHECVGFAIRTPGVMVLFAVLVAIFISCSGELKIRKFSLTRSKGYAFLLLTLFIIGFAIFKTYPLFSSGYAIEKIIDRHRSYYPSHTNMSEYDDALHQIEMADKTLASQTPPEAYMIKGQSQYMIACEILKRDGYQFNISNKGPVKNLLVSAINNMKAALRQYPTRSLYYVRIADCLQLLLELARYENKDVESQKLTKLITDTYNTAHYYSPKIGNITKNIALGNWRKVCRRLEKNQSIDPEDDDVREAIALFRKFAEQSPSETFDIYTALWNNIKSVQFLYAVTPQYISSYKNLYRFLMDKGLYYDAQNTLNKIIVLNEKNKSAKPDQYSTMRMSKESGEQLKQFVYGSKAGLAALRSDWNMYQEQLARYKENLRLSLDKELIEMESLYDKGDYNIVYSKLRNILKKDPTYSRAIVLASATCLQLGEIREYKKHLLSILFSKGSINSEIYRRLLHDLETLYRFQAANKNQYAFYKYALQYRILENKIVSKQLNISVSRIRDELSSIIEICENKSNDSFINFHLVYYFLGKTHALEGNLTQALAAFNKALKHTPHALFIINEAISTIDHMKKEGINIDTSTLQELKPFIEWSKKILPEKITDINYGNLVNLFGVSLSKKRIKPSEPVTISYYFECLNMIDREYLICSNFSSDNEFSFTDVFNLETNQQAESMITWKVGELIPVNRVVKPAVFSLQKKNSLPPTGNYYLNLYLYKPGADAHPISPAVNTQFPVFQIEK